MSYGAKAKTFTLGDVDPVNSPETCSDPAEFDLFLNTPGLDFCHELDRLSPETPLARARFGQFALATHQPRRFQQALNLLTDDEEPPAVGVRLMLQTMLGAYEVVVSSRFETVGFQPLQLESLCHSHAARGVAHAQLGQLEEALMNLSPALALAQALGLTHRAQMLGLERERILTLRGTPRPEEIARQLVSAMPPRRRAWGRRTHAESLLAIGAYSDALRSLGSQQGDTPRDAGLRDFLHVLIGLPQVHEAAGAYASVAMALRSEHLVGDHAEEIGKVFDEPEATYAKLAEAAAALRADQPEVAAQITCGLRGWTPHARCWVALTKLSAYLRGSERVNGLYEFQEVVEALGSMRATGEALQVIQRHAPLMFVLLAMSPAAGQLSIQGLSNTPLLSGQTLMYQGQSHRLPGRVGSFQVLDALGLPHGGIARTEKARLRDSFKRLNLDPVQAINLGLIARGCIRMLNAARASGQPRKAAEWRDAYHVAIKTLSLDVQDVLSMHPLD